MAAVQNSQLKKTLCYNNEMEREENSPVIRYQIKYFY